MAVKRLTQKLIDGLEYNGKTGFIRDAKTPGLILAVNKTSMSYKVQADLWQHRKLVKTVRHTMGTTEQLTLAQARARARGIGADTGRC